MRTLDGSRFMVLLRRGQAALVLVLVLVCTIGAPGAAPAQMALSTVAKQGDAGPKPVDPPEDIAPDDVEAFVAPLTDAQARTLLITTLADQADRRKAATSAEPDGYTAENILAKLRDGSSSLIANATALAEAVPQTGDSVSHAFLLLTDFEGWPRLLVGFGNLVLMILAGTVAAMLAKTYFFGLASADFVTLRPRTQRERLLGLLLRGAISTGQLVVFVVVGSLMSFVIFERLDPMRLFLIGWFGTVVLGVVAQIFARFLFAPTLKTLRLPDISDDSARVLSRWLVVCATIAAFFTFNGQMFGLLAIPPSLIKTWHILGGVLVFIVSVGAIHQCMRTGDRPRQDDGTSLGAVMARSLALRLPMLVMAGTAALLLVWSIHVFVGAEQNALFTLLAGLAYLAAWYVQTLGGHDHRDDVADRDPSPTPVARAGGSASVFSALLIVVGGFATIQATAVDLVALMQTPFGQQFGMTLAKVATTVVIAALAWAALSRLATRFIEREHQKAAEEQVPASEDAEGGTGLVMSRFGTLLPVIRGFALTTLVIITAMIVLSTIGIAIGPLLAGAGVIGIAIGFGAQTLVKDILSGVFFLVDDAFRVGEYIEFEDYRGEVERISIRSMRLRHHRGAIQTIPFGEMKVVTNHNRDWVIYKQEFQVPYEADIEKIRKIVKRIGLELLDDPDHGHKFLMQLKSQGVRRVENGVLVIRTKFMCKPREQFVLRRIVYQRVRDALYENGIELAHRRVQVELPPAADTKTGPDRAQLAAAAHSALEEETGPKKPVADEP